jgi:glucan phosphoethanolaminetransferase (alkaline phosphatase superfamily)
MEQEEKVLSEIKRILGIWGKEAKLLQFLLSLLGFIGIFCSVFITAFAGLDLLNSILVKIAAFTATFCLTVISAFNLPSKASNYITAWRLLNSAIYCYETRIFDIGMLIKAYNEGEKMLGCVDFQYNKPQMPKEM